MTKHFIFDMVHHNPGEARTKSSFLNPEKLADWGYNGQVLFTHVQTAVTFDSFDKTIFPEGSETRAWVENKAKELDAQMKACHDQGLLFTPFTDFIVFPSALVDKYRDEIACDGDKGDGNSILGEIKPDVHKPMTQKILRILIDEIFTRFPDMDGLMVRVGETYLHDIPYHTGGNPISRGVESHITLINLLKEEICEKRGKLLFYRTWLSGIDVNPEEYLQVTNSITPHPKLFIAVKHCVGDFHRTNAFSQVLGIGQHRQIVEVQCQREYEGKGAHPNYIAKGVIEGFEEYEYLMKSDEKQSLNDIAENPLYAGTWTWSRGGGWKGPYIQNEFWCELNAYVISHWAKDKTRSEEDIFAEFAELNGISGENLANFRDLCLKSSKGVLRGHSSVKGGINVWWTRDHYIGGLEQLSETFEQLIADERVEEVLAEKEEALSIWRSIVELAESLDITDKELLNHILISSKYGYFKYAIFAKSWAALLLGFQGDKTGGYEKERIKAAIEAYDQLWKDWKSLKDENPLCATLYNNHFCKFLGKKGMHSKSGLNDSIEKYRTV